MSLIQRLEQLTGPDREVDAAIQNAVFGWHKWATPTPWIAGDEGLPAYTASIDAALTLVSEGYDWDVGYLAINGEKYAADVMRPLHGEQDGSKYISFRGRGTAPAISICIAALKARGIE